MDPEYMMILYRPRWHGWARWELSRRDYTQDYVLIHVLERGWMRRPKDSWIKRYIVQDYQEIPWCVVA